MPLTKPTLSVGTRAGLMGSRSENILATVPGEASSVEVISGPRLAGPPGEGRRSHSRAADFETRPSSTPLGWSCWGVQPRCRPWESALAQGTRAGPTGEQQLQLAQCLEGGQADAAAFGSSRSKVTKAWATDTRVTW